MAQSDDPVPVEHGVPCSDAIDYLWKVIGRFDAYIGSTNTKAALLIAFNTFVPGSVALKWQDIQAAFGPAHREAFIAASVLLVIALGASVVSLVFTFRAISPFLKTPERPGDYHSDVFFGDVTKHERPELYYQRVREWTEERVQRDLSFQAHVLAQGLSGKFKCLKTAVAAVMFAELPMFGLMIVIYLYSVLSDVLHKAAG
jgi:Pycsar effector protein